MLESDASAWFSLSDLAEERAADWLAAAVNIATAVLGGGLDCLKRLLHASGSSAAVVGAAIESATRPQNALLITNVIPWLITLPEDIPFRLPDDGRDWTVAVDTSFAEGFPDAPAVASGAEYPLQGRSLVLLTRTRA